MSCYSTFLCFKSCEKRPEEPQILTSSTKLSVHWDILCLFKEMPLEMLFFVFPGVHYLAILLHACFLPVTGIMAVLNVHSATFKHIITTDNSAEFIIIAPYSLRSECFHGGGEKSCICADHIKNNNKKKHESNPLLIDTEVMLKTVKHIRTENIKALSKDVSMQIF